MILTRFLYSCFVALCVLTFTQQVSKAQSISFVKAIGSGGVGFGALSGSTRVSEDEIMFIDSYEAYGDVKVYRKYLTTYKVSKKSFSSKEIQYFRGSKLQTRGITNLEDHLAIFTTDYNNEWFIYLFDDDLNFEKRISIPPTATGDIERVGKNKIRLLSSTSGVTELITVDVENSVLSKSKLETDQNYWRYRRLDGVDYLLSLYDGTGSHVSRVDGLKTVKIAEDRGEISGFTVQNGSFAYFAMRADGPSLSISKNGQPTTVPYPGPHGNGYFSYTGKLVVPTYIYPLRNNRLLLADGSSVAVVDDNFTFSERYGAIDTYSSDGQPQQHAINSQGDVVVGRTGYVSVVNKSGAFSVPLLCTDGTPAQVNAMTFLPNGDILATYWGNWDIFRYKNETGIFLIDAKLRKVKKHVVTEFGVITDIAVNGAVYIAADGLLYTLDSQLSKAPQLVPSTFQVVDLYVQSGFLYVRSVPNKIVKVSSTNEIVEANMYADTFSFIDVNFGGYVTHFAILPDESMLTEYVGYVTKDNRQLVGYYLPQYIGNGSGQNLVISDAVLRYRN